MSNIGQNSKTKFQLEYNLQDGQYIANILKSDVIKDWKRGHKVLICANTGSGKTYFVMNTLYQMCKEKGYKILLLTNRVALKEQLLNLYGETVPKCCQSNELSIVYKLY